MASISRPSHSPSAWRPQSFALALEPRILFDAAAASAVDHQRADAHDSGDTARPPATPSDAPAAPPPARHLVVIDSRIAGHDGLVADAARGVQTLVLDAGDDGLAAISAALARLGEVDSIQIFSHGASGQFTLGDRVLTAETVRELHRTFAAWQPALSADADIQLYGCNVGAGSAGQALVSELARWTGADVAASNDATGSRAAGGDWTLETRQGVIDQSLALTPASVAAYDALLADADPTTTLPSGSSSVLLGEQFSFTVSLTNPSTQVGYAPFVDLFIPSTGRDGNDGVNFISASYLGNPIQAQTLVFDAAGKATHPLARGADGAPLVVDAASFGMRPGDRLVVLLLPFSSVSQGQPAIDVVVTASLSNLADTTFSDPAPDLTIRARSGFQLGNDSVDNPTADPSLVEATTQAFVVHPTVVALTQRVSMPEGETVTGPNHGRSLTITAQPAVGQPVNNVVVTQTIPGNVQVTAITPAAGGTITSLTMADGSVLADATEIAAAIAADNLFIAEFTVRYASITGPVDTVVDFYVPQADSNGQPIIDAATGDAVTITFPGTSARGQWVPLDARDLTPPATGIVFSGTGDPASFVARSITVAKHVSLRTDIGQTGLTPGDTLQYTLDIDVSDYFAFGENFFEQGQFVIVDQLADGQTVTGTPTLSITAGGVTRTIALVATNTPNADGSSTLTLDLAASIRTQPIAFPTGALIGDLAFEDVLDGATRAVVGYSALVAQNYTPPAGAPHGTINEGDSFGNSATLTATVLEDRFNLTGFAESDTSATTSTIGTRTVDVSIFQVNGAAPPGNGELRPGDVVTFRMAYDLLTGDYEQFKLTAYMPLPLTDLSGITWAQGVGLGRWSFGLGNTNADTSVSVANGPGNSVVFDFGDFTTATTTGSRVEVLFSLRVGDQPFADQRSLNVLAQSQQQTTLTDQTLVSSNVVQIVSIAEPVLALVHGVVAASHGTVTGTTGTWNAPGTAGAPFQGSVTSPAAADGSVSGIDAGDLLRLATVIENSGGGGAFDVTTTVTLPPGITFAGGSLGAANLRVYRGDGSALVAGVDYSVAGNQITFLDAGGVATLGAGRSGTAADASGANVVVISYDVSVSAGIPAGRTLESSAALTRYASVNGGTDFVPVDIVETAGQQVAAPVIAKGFAGGSLDAGDSSAAHTAGADLVVGESMLYDIVVTLPEGNTQNLRIDDFVPAGMRLDTTFNGGLGYQIITTTSGSAALTANFNGSVSAGAAAGQGGTAGNDGVDVRLTFSAAGASADNITGNDRFVIRVRLVVDNVSGNQANRSLQNGAQLVYGDPDGDTANGSVALDRTVGLTGGQPTVTLREPTLIVEQTTRPIPGLGVDEGSVVEYTIVIRNGSGGNDVDAFDLGFIDNLPSQLGGLTLVSTTYAGGATHNGGADFEISGRQLRSVAGANIDVARGGSITLVVRGIVNASAASVPSFDNVATVQWTSLNGSSGASGSPTGERTGADGTLGGGALNDYRTSATLTIPVAQGAIISRVGGLGDTPAATPTDGASENAAIGELIRYRVAALLSEGSTSNYNLQVTLQNGLGFVNDGTVRIAFVSDNGLTSSVAALITDGTLNVVGNDTSAIAQPIRPDLSGAAPAGVLNASQVVVSTDAGGNTVLTFNLGTVVNADSDADLEGVVIEFNVRVLNQASNVAGISLAATAVDRSGTTALSSGRTVSETIVEPRFTAMDKRVIDFDPVEPDGSGTGRAGVSIGFTQSGGMPAYDVRLTDAFAGGTGYEVGAVVVNGTTYTAAQWAAQGISVGTGGGIDVRIARLDPGDVVRVEYAVTVPNGSAIASSDATLTWSSLPESFTSWGGSSVGGDGSASGERTGSGSGPNTYVQREGAGLGVIAGRLWNDTASATGSSTPDGPGLAGQTVTLTWGGIDGNLATAGDNRVYTTTTDANGAYRFGVLPAGAFRIDAPSGTISDPLPLGDLRVRIDTDAATPLGRIDVTLGEGATATADAGYVEQNDAPVNTLPGTRNGSEDVPLSIGGISVADVDAGGGTLEVRLSVLHGTLSLSSLPAGVTATGGGTATLTLTGTVTALNGALANLVYLGNANFNGIDTLTVLTNDRGGRGDADGDGIPNENPQDARTDQDTLGIVLAAVNDAPVASPDAADAVEAGGTDNTTTGIDPRGDLLANDTDVDIATNGDRLRVVQVGRVGSGAILLPNIAAATVPGLYGSLVVSSSGAYTYVVDNTHAAVQALRLSGQTLTEQFQYTVLDQANAQSTSVLTVTIHGANDTPVGNNDSGTAVEAGGVANGSGGSDGTGNVLTNDGDVDSVANGETRRVTGIRNVPEGVQGPLTAVNAGTTSANGTVIAGRYGTLSVGADGSWRYVVDDTRADVQSLVPGDTLIDSFSYQLTDAAGLNDLATLRITITGSQDNPLASDDEAHAQAGAGPDATGESNPVGNVILLPSRPGTVDQAGGNGVDLDVDRTDQPNDVLVVDGIRTGLEGAGGALTAVAAGSTAANGTVIVGTYGTLRVGADGSFVYDVDSGNAAVQALVAGATLNDTFTYRLADTSSATDLGQLVVVVHGVNDPPVAQLDGAIAREAGGAANGAAGNNPSGSVLATDRDPDGDPISVVAVRTGPEAGSGTSGTVGQPLAGAYGSLTLQADGTFTYAVDNTLAAVQALRTGAQVLIERFTYTVSDAFGESDTAEIVIVVRGQNDDPVAADDTAVAVEAGGASNKRPGVDPTGNVLTNDTDVDGGERASDPIDYGETLVVSSVRTGTETGSGSAGTLGSELRGNYGWLRLNADGSYSYRVDNSLAAVQALRGSGNTLADSFSYTVADAAGAQDRATLTITIQGANDAPVAVDDTGTAIEAGGAANATAGRNAEGNVLDNDSDVDANGETMTVVDLRQGGRVGIVGGTFVAAYGSLTLNADGSFSYVVDDTNPIVEALRTNGDTLTETFRYTVRDAAGETGTATLVIVVRGRDDTPVARDDTALAIEAGGTRNTTPGLNPRGGLLDNDSDVDASDSAAITGLRTGAEADGGSYATLIGRLALVGLYGTLTVSADGSYSYQVNNSLAAVQALQAGQTLVEMFSYRVRDGVGATDTAQLQITIRGAWDAPVAADNLSLAVADNGKGNSINPTANALNNDTDVDQDDVLTITGIRTGAEAAGGALQAVNAGTNSTDGTLIDGLYGQLIVGADGSYTYNIDSSHPDVQALGPLQFLNEVFTYRVDDLGGRGDLAQIRILIRGRNEAPIPVDDAATAIEAGGVANGTPGSVPGGNVLANDSDIEDDALTVTAIRTGAASQSGSAGSVGAALRGLYGDLTIAADGRWSYVVDDTLAAVQALRQSGQTLSEVFTYTVADVWGADATAELTITIDGRNDTPVASDDDAVSTEAGGVANATPGIDPSGNVLDNDSDVDGVDNGETRRVVSVVNELGQSAAAGAVLAGRYGQLTLNADGSYAYVLDNGNPVVEALRSAGQTLREVFTYTIVDAAGATAQARLHVLIQGANDNPVAADDESLAQDQTPTPQVTGNVLGNDTDVDGGDARQVVGVRAGPEGGSGAAGTVGQALAGRYGTLVIEADGSYTYAIDLSNPEVLAAAGLGQVLDDVFTYTVADLAGATDQAQLVIHLEIAAPYIAPEGIGPNFQGSDFIGGTPADLPALRPGLFVTPVVQQDADMVERLGQGDDGAKVYLVTLPELQADSIGAGLGSVQGQFVGAAVESSRRIAEASFDRLAGRHGRVSLSADGLLSDPSPFAVDPRHLVRGPAQPASTEARSAAGFEAQLRAAAQRLHPLAPRLPT